MGSSAYSLFGSGPGADSGSDSLFGYWGGSYLQKRCNSMELPSPNMSGDERSTTSMRSSACSSNISEAEEESR
ncbi:hypothetical protein R3I94_022773 [Phoxinus phoxinus]